MRTSICVFVDLSSWCWLTFSVLDHIDFLLTQLGGGITCVLILGRIWNVRLGSLPLAVIAQAIKRALPGRQSAGQFLVSNHKEP